MLWRIINVVKGTEGKGKKTKESFSLEFCKIDALIPPDERVPVQYVSVEEIIFKSLQDLKEDSQIPFQITYYPLKPPKAPGETIQTSLTLVKKGQLATSKFLYKAQYSVKNDPGLKKFFKYLKEIEDLQLDKKVDYHDRRIHFRINRILPVFSKDIKEFKCLTRNLSTGGAMLACAGGVKKGDVISMRLELDDYSEDALLLTGEVCWVEDSIPTQIQVGIRFLDVPEHEQKVLHKYIESIKKRI